MAAFKAGGGNFVAPAQRLVDFIAGRQSQSLPNCSYHRGLESSDLNPILGPLAAPIREALISLGKKMPAFLQDDAIAVGVETRTSSPVQLPRDPDSLESLGVRGVYACGEGAGYAGGIVSAAIDGMRVADQIAGPSPTVGGMDEFADALG